MIKRLFKSNIALIFIAGILMCLFGVGVMSYKKIDLGRKCVGYLKRAADANTVILAKTELDIALTYLEKTSLTSGHTSILWTTPNEDIGYWYSNLKAAQKDLKRATNEASQLTESNVLIKLRETLLDYTHRGTSVTVPQGLYLYPHNTFWLFYKLIMLGGVILTGVLILKN